MGSMTVRKIDDEVMRELRISAARRGVSMEQEARDRISRPLQDDTEPDRTAGRNWYLEASLEDILALGRKRDHPIDHKVESDALYDYLDEQ